MSLTDVTNLADYRRARERAVAVPPETWRIVTEHLSDHQDIHWLMHERIEVVEAGIRFLEGHVEAFGPGGWSVAQRPYHENGIYITCVLTMRFPDV